MNPFLSLPKTHNHSNHSTSPPDPRKLLICFLSQSVCIFWIFDANGMKQCAALGDWLLSLILQLSRFIRSIASISASFLFSVSNVSCLEISHFIHSIHPLRDIWIASSFLVMIYNATLGICVQDFHGHMLLPDLQVGIFPLMIICLRCLGLIPT